MSLDTGKLAKETTPTFVWRFQREPMPEARKYIPFSIVGQYANNLIGFVQHAALLASECELSSTSEVPVWHMGPPVYASDVNSHDINVAPKCRADLIVEIPLSSSERNSMLHWKAKVDKERRPSAPFQQYKIAPPVAWVRSELGRKQYRRFSCAGFVMSCYAAAGISILRQDAVLPEASLADVESCYPDLKRIANMRAELKAKFGFISLEDLGIPGPGPWRIVLAGYLFNAFKNVTAQLPNQVSHSPTSVAEAYYPAKETSVEGSVTPV